MRAFRASDADALMTIAETAFLDTRFSRDPGFPRERVARLYGVWLEQSYAGRADAVLVSHDRDTANGFITCHLDEPGLGHIGLVGVSEAAQGGGIGRRLLEAALSYF